MDAIAGLSNEAEIENALYELFRENRKQAHDFMWWRMGIKKYAKRP